MVDVCTALLLKSEIGSISRFGDYKKLVSWAGLAPCVHQSGCVSWNGAVTKCGSGILRGLLLSLLGVLFVMLCGLVSFMGGLSTSWGSEGGYCGG